METRNVLPAALEAMKDWGGCTRPDNAPYWSPSAAIWASVSAHPSLITSVHFSASPPQRDISYCGRGRPVNFPECAGSGVAYVSLAQRVQQPRHPALCPGRGVRDGPQSTGLCPPSLAWAGHTSHQNGNRKEVTLLLPWRCCGEYLHQYHLCVVLKHPAKVTQPL